MVSARLPGNSRTIHAASRFFAASGLCNDKRKKDSRQAPAEAIDNCQQIESFRPGRIINHNRLLRAF
jgi:hypothetical protein